MMMNFKQILDEAETYVAKLFDSHANAKLVYHNISHTKKVVQNSAMIGRQLQLNEQNLFIVQLAAWFHDVGYLLDIENHEQAGADDAAKILQTLGVDNEIVESVKGAIMATRLPQKPTNLVEQIVCDADLYHLGTVDFTETNKLVRKERLLLYPNSFTKYSWLKKKHSACWKGTIIIPNLPKKHWQSRNKKIWKPYKPS